ncbi:MAG: serine/threonine-protein kinase [Polyangiales bacterium]
MSDANARTPEMLDRYELVAPLARGGMGSVHLARLPGVGGFQRLYAIKVMHPHLAEEEEFVAMLLDEARLAARIHHPNAVAIVDVCQGSQGFYLVMDYVDGVTLAKLLSATASFPWRQRVSAALRVIVDALSGLHAAHELTDDDGAPLNIVHRDVSPQNILVGTDGAGRITDFGIALAASRIAASRPGMIKGKPSYMAPEQITAGPADRRADVFAVGIVLWEALTGRRLFTGDTEMAVMMQVMTAEVPAPSTYASAVPPILDEVCAWALSREVGARPATARALAQAIESAASEHGLLASTHEVADLLATAFSDEFAARRALVREHAKASDALRSAHTGTMGTPRVATMTAPRSGPRISGDDIGVRATEVALPTPTGLSATSIPAIEVRAEAAIPPMRPVAGAPESVAPSPPASRRRWLVPFTAGLVAVGVSAAVLASRRPETPRAPVAAASVVATTPPPRRR